MTATYTLMSSPPSTATAPMTSLATGRVLGQARPELLEHRLDLYSSEARMVFGATTMGQHRDAGPEH